MRAPYTQLYVHCVWATWDRLPLITSTNEPPIYTCIMDKCKDLKCLVLALNGTADHVHLLVRLPNTIAIADLLKEVKGASSHLVTHQVDVGEFFKWQGAYGAFTVSKNLIPKVKKYIEQQKEHHSENTLRPEWEQTYTEE